MLHKMLIAKRRPGQDWSWRSVLGYPFLPVGRKAGELEADAQGV